MNEKIELLKDIPIPDTQIIHVSYESNGAFTSKSGQIFKGLPPFYRVVLKSKPTNSSLIISEVWLPEHWNGIYIGLGNGGMAGNICHADLCSKIKEGYAAANSDLGTSRGEESGINNPDVWKDFGWRANEIMTKAAKTIIHTHYGTNENYSYFVGASTGGQQALSIAQRLPFQYDGIIAGVPANNRIALHVYFLWNHIHLRSKDGTRFFNDSEIQNITDLGVKYFQGLKDSNSGDNFISFPISGDKLISDFIAFIANKNPKFTSAQLDALKAVYTGPVNPVTKERIYNGMPIGSEIYGGGISDHQAERSPHFYPFIWAFGKEYDGRSFDFNKDMKYIFEKLSKDLNANSADLSDFNSHGGKIIMYSGSADPCVPFPDAMNYYKRSAAANGGYENLMTFFRYFLIPGMDHGNGGCGANVIWNNLKERKEPLCALRLWRERGIAPESLTAVGFKNKNPEEEILFSREIYPCGKDDCEKCPPVCCDSYLNEN